MSWFGNYAASLVEDSEDPGAVDVHQVSAVASSGHRLDRSPELLGRPDQGKPTSHGDRSPATDQCAEEVNVRCAIRSAGVPLNGGTPLVDDPLHYFPFCGNFAVSVAAVMVGLASRAVDELALLAEKTPARSRQSLGEKSAARSAIAEADAAVRMARALIRESVADAWQAAQKGTVNVEHRRLLRLAASASSERCQFAITTCFSTAGGTAVYETSPLQRVQRDAMVAAKHAMIGRSQLERVGALQFGSETDLRGF